MERYQKDSSWRLLADIGAKQIMGGYSKVGLVTKGETVVAAAGSSVNGCC